MDIVVPHRVIYDFDGRATVAEVAKSLIAQERLVRWVGGVEAETAMRAIHPTALVGHGLEDTAATPKLGAGEALVTGTGEAALPFG